MQSELKKIGNDNKPYKLPDGWKWVRFVECLDKNKNVKIKGIPQKDYKKSGKYPIIDQGQKLICGYTDNSGNLYNGDLPVIIFGDHTRIFKYIDFPFAVGADGTKILSPNKEILLPEFFYFALLNLKIKSLGYSRHYKLLKEIKIILPPIPEQHRIVKKLQEIMKDIDKTITSCERELEAAKKLSFAFLREVFESEESKKWKKKKLDEVCEVFSGSSAPQDKKYFENGKHPFVRVKDLGRYKRTTDLKEVDDYINDDAIKELKLIKAKKGTILFPKSGAAIITNNRAILGIDAFIVSHLAAIYPKFNLIDTHFIYYWLCLVDMTRYMENPGYPSLKLSVISKTVVPIPPIPEQYRIVSELKQKMDYVNKLQSKIEEQLEAINVLPQSILKKAFRGEI